MNERPYDSDLTGMNRDQIRLVATQHILDARRGFTPPKPRIPHEPDVDWLIDQHYVAMEGDRRRTRRWYWIALIAAVLVWVELFFDSHILASIAAGAVTGTCIGKLVASRKRIVRPERERADK